MKRQLSISALNKRFSLAIGLFAAIMVVCTSLLQFQLEVQGDPRKREILHAQPDVAQDGTEDSAGDSDEVPYTLCTIQAVSHGIQLHVVYDPLIWEFAEIELPELKVMIPREVYSTSWEYFKVLFSDIISPNAP